MSKLTVTGFVDPTPSGQRVEYEYVKEDDTDYRNYIPGSKEFTSLYLKSLGLYKREPEVELPNDGELIIIFRKSGRTSTFRFYKERHRISDGDRWIPLSALENLP